MISTLRMAADVEGELLVWAPEGRAARPEPSALPQPLPALRHAEKPPPPAAQRDLPAAAPITLPPVSPTPVAPTVVAAAPEAERRQLTVMFCDLVGSTALSGLDGRRSGSHVTRRWRKRDSNPRSLSGWGLHAVENVDVRSGRGRRLRRRRVRGRRPAGKSRGTDPLARGRCGPTPRAGNRRSRETPDCRAA
jgi:hypothetical protein